MKTPVNPVSQKTFDELVEYGKSPEYEQDQQRYNELLVRSATDLEFRQRLLDTPMEALAEFYGQEIPDEARLLSIKFIENEADATIVLPDPVTYDAELSDYELESVAGGTGPACASAAAGTTGSPASAVVSAIVSGGFALAVYWLSKQ